LLPWLQIVTFTSDAKGAATDASVHIELIDAGGASSGRKQLRTSAPDAFERGKVDEFRIKCQALGNLIKLRIGQDGKGAHPAWHLAKVRVLAIAWVVLSACVLVSAGGQKLRYQSRHFKPLHALV
jgi:hypothetical protein